MPNWCENKLCIYGYTEALNNFIEIVKNPEDKSDLSMAKLLPCPEELFKHDAPNRNPDDYCAELIKKYGHADWYDWCVANWGTKWDLCSVRTTCYGPTAFDDYYVEYYFESAWSPPTQWIISIAPRFPTLSFCLKYDEPGMGFLGVLVVENEKIISDESINY